MVDFSFSRAAPLPGSITDLPGAQISVTPLESATHLVVVRFGAGIGL
ncbi:MAG TPA: hypothetical protein VKA54_08865 [Gemmatimonadaceae bacterium]|nr:hypothetical protein [Gemmatimonadaceae bacterium]